MCKCYIGKPCVPADLNILQVSKLIKTEAEEILYRKATFRFEVTYEDAWLGDEAFFAAAPSQEEVDRMRNIEIVLWGYFWRNCGPASAQRAMQEKMIQDIVIGKFAGKDGMVRDTCCVKIEGCNDKEDLSIIQTGIFQELKKFVGFKTITLEVTSHVAHQTELIEIVQEAAALNPTFPRAVLDDLIVECSEGQLAPIPSAKLRHISEEFPYEFPDDMAVILSTIKRELEPYLGPGTEGDVPGAVNVFYSRYVRFQPQIFCSKTLAAKAEELEMESNTVGSKTNF